MFKIFLFEEILSCFTSFNLITHGIINDNNILLCTPDCWVRAHIVHRVILRVRLSVSHLGRTESEAFHVFLHQQTEGTAPLLPVSNRLFSLLLKTTTGVFGRMAGNRHIYCKTWMYWSWIWWLRWNWKLFVKFNFSQKNNLISWSVVAGNYYASPNLWNNV